MDGKKKRVVKQETKKQDKEVIGQAKLCFKPQTPTIVVLEDRESSVSSGNQASIKSQQDKHECEEGSLEEEKGDLLGSREEAGEDLKMSEEKIGATDLNI